VFLSLFIASIVGVIFARNAEGSLSPGALIALYTTMLFFCSMVCHGELYRLRPQASHLTTYYLAIAAGGAMGGIFVAVVAPLIFSVYHELHIGLLICAATLLMTQQGLTVSQQKRRRIWVFVLLIAGTIGIIFQGRKTTANQTAIDNCRNFFGVLTVWDESPQDSQTHKLLLQHGTTFHGLQFQNPQKKLLPTAYYSPESGIGLLLRNMPRQDRRKIGIVGLGVGTIAIYGQPSDTIRFYEINPQVEQMARKYFSYLSQSKAAIEIVLGDARLSMENESPQQYDVLVLDAFSSDAVPIHLLTKEAFEIYLKHLSPDGVLAFHISTMHLNLHSVVWKAAKELGLSNLWIENEDDPETGRLASDWILLSRESSALNIPALQAVASPQKNDLPDIRLWTDDHINLLQILK
jgi:spermidine synthase